MTLLPVSNIPPRTSIQILCDDQSRRLGYRTFSTFEESPKQSHSFDPWINSGILETVMLRVSGSDSEGGPSLINRDVYRLIAASLVYRSEALLRRAAATGSPNQALLHWRQGYCGRACLVFSCLFIGWRWENQIVSWPSDPSRNQSLSSIERE